MKLLFKIFFCLLISISLKAQPPAPSGLPAPYSTGYYRVGWLQRDSGDIPAFRDTNFIPKFQGTTILWLHAGFDSVEWTRIGNKWIKKNSGGTGGSGLNQLTGDVLAGPGTGSQVATLATVNTNTGSFGDASHVAQITLNGKGLNTAAGSIVIQIPEAQVTNLVTDLAGKQPTITTGSTSQYFRGDLSLATFPTNLSSFTNGPGYITGNQTITLSGGATGSGTTSIPVTLASVITAGSCTNCNLTYNAAGQLTIAGNGASGNLATASGDATGTVSGTNLPLTLATVNGNIGSFGTASNVGSFTVNAKGLITAASNTAIQIAESQVTNLVTDLAGKQATGNYITSLTTDVVAAGPGAAVATIQPLAVTTGKIANNAVTLGKMATNTANTLLGYDGSGNAADVSLTTTGSGAASIVAGVLNIPTPSGTVTSQNSITGNGSSGTPLQLVNDLATPPPYQVYGTDTSGVRKYKIEPYVIKKIVVQAIDTVNNHWRMDQSSIIRLSKDSLLILYSNSNTSNVSDVGPSNIWGATSGDNGLTWVNNRLRIPNITQNTNTPSLYNDGNGNIYCFTNNKYLTTPLQSTICRWKSTNGGNNFTFVDSLVSASGTYWYSSGDRIIRSQLTGRLFFPLGQITNRSLAYFRGRFMYSDDNGVTWTLSAQIFTSPDSVVNEPLMYIVQRTPDTQAAGEFIRYGFSTNVQYEMWGAQSIDNGATWTGSYNMGMPTPYSQPAVAVIDGQHWMIGVANKAVGGATQQSQRKYLDLLTSTKDYDFNQPNNALSLGNQWRTLFSLLGSDSASTYFEPSIFYDSTKGNIIVQYAHFDSLEQRSSLEILLVPIGRVRGEARQSYSTMNLAFSGPEIVASSSGLFNLYNRQTGYAAAHLSFGTLSGNFTDMNPVWYYKGTSGTAAGMLYSVAPGSDFDVAYYSALLSVNGTVSTMPLFKACNANVAKFSVGFDGKTSIGNATRSAWLTLSAGTATAGFAPIQFTAGPPTTTPVAGQMQYNTGLWIIDSSASIRDTVATRSWHRANAGAGSAPPFADNAALVKNNSDATKLLILSAASITTATTRTATFPDANITVADKLTGLQQFASTTSAQLLGVISDETGTGPLVFGTSPSIATPLLTGLTSSGANDSIVTVDPTTGQTHRKSGTFNLKVANGLRAPTTDSIYWGGTLIQPTAIAGGSFKLELGTNASNLGEVDIRSNDNITIGAPVGTLALYGTPQYSGLTATDANTTVSVGSFNVYLPVITANRTLTIPFTNTGHTQTIFNTNTSAFAWTFATTVKDNLGNTVTAIPNGVTYTLVYNGTNWILESASNLGYASGSVSQVGTATTTFTVTIGKTESNSTYKVNVTPTSALSAALFYVTNKTATTFDVTYLAGLTGTVSFDWNLVP